eukprot:c21250_g1_i1.p1 GENE.c21250_g1_i1~~c21250_g1_i1.p1  ORF type:complete len:347 (+),score=71.68 c21250_g1_i1:37-1077(+)
MASFQRTYKVGAGGRSSLSGVAATVFGCDGFLARYIVNQLGRVGSQVVVPNRGGELKTRHLKLMGDVGRIIPLDFSLKNDDSIRRSVSRSNTAINCIGKFWDSRNFTLESLHIDHTAKLARICKESGVEEFVHISALGADKNSSNRFLRTKALGEEAVRSEFPSAVILRVAPLVGPEDKLLNWYAMMHRQLWFVPVFYGGYAVHNVVNVGDVAQCVKNVVMSVGAFDGKTIEVSGPESLTQYDMIEYLRSVAEFKPTVLTLGSLQSRLFGKICDRVPDHFLLGDFSSIRLGLFDHDLVPSNDPAILTSAALNVTPRTVRAQTGSWLKMWRFGTPFNVDVPEDKRVS